MRKTVRAVFNNIELLHADDISKSEELKKLIKIQLPEVIGEALSQNKIYASLFEINDSSCYIDIHKNNWVQSLETCLLWYVEDENYEMCTKIKDLIHKIQSKSKSNKIQLTEQKDGEGF